MTWITFVNRCMSTLKKPKDLLTSCKTYYLASATVKFKTIHNYADSEDGYV